jgi:hypothetical protein
VYEDTPVGTVVHTLEGQDPEGSRLLYTISSDFFSVDSDSGAVSLIKPLDRELRDTVDVVITIQVMLLSNWVSSVCGVCGALHE